MTQISVLGCGWLGLPLSKSLLSKGFLIKGSTTSGDKLNILEQNGIQSFQIALKETEIIGGISSFLQNSEILIINIPPKLRGSGSEDFVSKIKTLLSFVEKSTINHVIFTSSTSVYADEPLASKSVTEETTPNPATESGKQLVAAEKLLMENKNFRTTILRFGGLIGENRHPVFFLSGKINLENPNAPINLIHQEDCIGIIEKIILKNKSLDGNKIFNAVAPFHPSRKDYYTQKAIELNLPLPIFDESKSNDGKIILSHKIEEDLGYSFKHSKL